MYPEVPLPVKLVAALWVIPLLGILFLWLNDGSLSWSIFEGSEKVQAGFFITVLITSVALTTVLVGKGHLFDGSLAATALVFSLFIPLAGFMVWFAMWISASIWVAVGEPQWFLVGTGFVAFGAWVLSTE